MMGSIIVLNDMHVKGDAYNHVVSVDVFSWRWGCARSAALVCLGFLCRVSCARFLSLFGSGAFLSVCLLTVAHSCGVRLVHDQSLGFEGHSTCLGGEECQCRH